MLLIRSITSSKTRPLGNPKESSPLEQQHGSAYEYDAYLKAIIDKALLVRASHGSHIEVQRTPANTHEAIGLQLHLVVPEHAHRTQARSNNFRRFYNTVSVPYIFRAINYFSCAQNIITILSLP